MLRPVLIPGRRQVSGPYVGRSAAILDKADVAAQHPAILLHAADASFLDLEFLPLPSDAVTREQIHPRAAGRPFLPAGEERRDVRRASTSPPFLSAERHDGGIVGDVSRHE